MRRWVTLRYGNTLNNDVPRSDLQEAAISLQNIIYQAIRGAIQEKSNIYKKSKSLKADYKRFMDWATRGYQDVRQISESLNDYGSSLSRENTALLSIEWQNLPDLGRQFRQADMELQLIRDLG